ncbi:MAG: hypothetical protein CMB38_04390, partial [Euryarchaeota archaeon]|nr:hypothetical protein [Euryarchaeota archaeon]
MRRSSAGRRVEVGPALAGIEATSCIKDNRGKHPFSSSRKGRSARAAAQHSRTTSLRPRPSP